MHTRSEGSISLPYGAAALTRLLSEADAAPTTADNKPLTRDDLAKEIETKIATVYHTDLQMPADMAARSQERGGITLYLSGGGFRAWGYLLMNNVSQPSAHPTTPDINGFKVSGREFADVDDVLRSMAEKQVKIPGIPKRRIPQIPAVAFLVRILCSSSSSSSAIPDNIKDVVFCRGGVREGYLLDHPDALLSSRS